LYNVTWDHTSVVTNGISVHPVVLAGCTSVTDDVQRDQAMVMCCKRCNCFQRCLIMGLVSMEDKPTGGLTA